VSSERPVVLDFESGGPFVDSGGDCAFADPRLPQDRNRSNDDLRSVF
jgi:hypothetical protein